MNVRIAGFAVPLVLLVSAIALAAVVSTTLISAISARQVASLERRATTALFAAESGLNTVVPRSHSADHPYIGGSVSDWLDAAGLSEYTLPGGAIVQMQAIGQTATRVTIRSEGTAAGNSRRVILQDFSTYQSGTGRDAALITIPPLKTNSKKSRLIGLDTSVAAWKFLHPAGAAVAGDYLEYEGSLYQVEAVGEDVDVVLLPRDEPPVTSSLSLATPVTLIPYALSADFTYDGNNPSTVPVTVPSKYPEGSTIYIGNTPNEGTDTAGYEGIVVSASADNDESPHIVVEWTSFTPSDTILEGTPVRRLVDSALAQTGGCPEESTKLDEKLPQGCVDEDLGDLFTRTFPGFTKTSLKELAANQEDALPSAVYPQNPSTSWPTGEVQGLTWIDYASTGDANSLGLCGSGVVILSTGPASDGDPQNININVDGDCAFSGVLYVMGQLQLQGNLDSFTGTIITEGPGEFTNVQGTGEKALYDPIAVRNAMAALGGFETDVLSAIPSSWRFGE